MKTVRSSLLSISYFAIMTMSLIDRVPRLRSAKKVAPWDLLLSHILLWTVYWAKRWHSSKSVYGHIGWAKTDWIWNKRFAYRYAFSTRICLSFASGWTKNCYLQVFIIISGIISAVWLIKYNLWKSIITNCVDTRGDIDCSQRNTIAKCFITDGFKAIR